MPTFCQQVGKILDYILTGEDFKNRRRVKREI